MINDAGKYQVKNSRRTAAGVRQGPLDRRAPRDRRARTAPAAPAAGPAV